MADTKVSRNKQARNAERRQCERELAEALERRDETEPPLEVEEEAVAVEPAALRAADSGADGEGATE
ncbi:hypothetical protein [Natrinema caseinilyticum]|uniref:hypothetical protein n=1 Tax=Natrinema caseinilyticum TaxID=2961570 RepID=UPI0020C31CD8|nr:hypothetical protein [Natrinema caseinilyticum]